MEAAASKGGRGGATGQPATSVSASGSASTSGSASLDERRRALLVRAQGMPVVWGWPDRLAVAALGALLLGLVLPWATDPALDPLWLGDAGRANGALVGIAAAAVAVPLRLVLLYRGERLQVVVGLAGAAALVGGLRVGDLYEPTWEPLVPGRVSTVVGGVGLIAASGGMARAAAVRRKAALAESWTWDAGPGPVGERQRTREHEAVQRELARVPPGPRGTGWITAALVLVAAGAAALAGPWWQGREPVPGPYSAMGPRVTASEPVLDAGASARTLRSGIDVLGPARVWAVAGVVLAATLAAVWFSGRRRGGQVVVASGALVLGLLVAGLVELGTGRTAVGAVAAAAVALGVALAGVRQARLGPTGAARTLPLLLAGPGLLAATWSVVDGVPTPERDGPYRVLIPAAPEYGGTGSFDGAPGAETMADSLAPLWVGGLPGAVGSTAAEDGPGWLGLWVVRDGRVEVRSLVGDDHGMAYDDPSTFEVAADGTMLRSTTWPDGYGLNRLLVMRPGGDGEVWLLPHGTEDATFGPGDHVLMWGAAPERIDSPEGTPWSPDAIYVATVDQLARPEVESTTIDEWPEWPGLSERTGRPGPPGGPGRRDVPTGQLAADGRTVVTAGPDDVVAQEPDGSRRTVLGGVTDPACGLNREATSSTITEDWDRVDDLDARPRLSSADQRVAPAPDGGLWAALPTPEPDDGRAVLGKVDLDGTLRLVDHELPSIEGIALSPDGDTVVLVDTRGRLLELPDAEAALEPAPPPPDGCSPDAGAGEGVPR